MIAELYQIAARTFGADKMLCLSVAPCLGKDGWGAWFEADSEIMPFVGLGETPEQGFSDLYEKLQNPHG